jgi:putative peptide modification system cyclase
VGTIQIEHIAVPSDRAINAPVLRTLLVCDLAESTALVEKLGDLGAAELMRRHDRLSRDLLHGHGGREIDKTDGFLLMFERPIQAVAFALGYQRQLKNLGAAQSIDLKARIGIHVGDIVQWENDATDVAHGAKPVEIEGLVKPVAARLMGIARPGQILLSGIAYTLALRARSELDDACVLRWCAHGNYRFKGVPEAVPVFEVGEAGVAPFRSPAWSGKARREIPWWRRPGALALEAIAALLLAAAPVYYLLRSPPTIAFAKRDWVVVGDFKNLTGESISDDSLQTAFRLGLEESRYVNVLSPIKVRDTLQRMQRDPEQTKVDRAIGSEVAIREDARALILPTLAKVGGHMRITAEVIDPNTLVTVYSESADGIGAESLLASVDKVNQQLRVRLGEALATVSSESQPLEKVATKNLDALRAYSLGLQAYAGSRPADARDLFQQAVKLDPEFALAYIGIARTYYGNDDLATAKDYLDRAAVLEDRLSARDRLYLDAWLTGFGPSRPRLAKWKLLSQLYPDYYAAYYNYAYFAWRLENRAADGVAAIQPALTEHNPQRGNAYYALAYMQAAENQFDAAVNNFNVAVSLGSHQQGIYRAATYAAQRRFAEADQVLSQAKPMGIATIDIFLPRLGIVQQLDRGHWEHVRSGILEAAANASKVGPLYDRTYRAMVLSLDDYTEPKAEQISALRNFITGARKASEQPPSANHEDAVFAAVFGAYLAARAGEKSLARTTLAATAPQTRDSGYTNLEHLQSIAEAEVAWREGRAQDAVARLEPTLDGTELYLTHVALVDAYTAAGRNEDAFREAQWLAAHRGRAYLEINSLQMLQARNVAESDLAFLRMAELAHVLGRDDEARKQLAAFDAIWPRNSLPSFIAARVENLSQVLHLASRQLGESSAKVSCASLMIARAVRMASLEASRRGLRQPHFRFLKSAGAPSRNIAAAGSRRKAARNLLSLPSFWSSLSTNSGANGVPAIDFPLLEAAPENLA